VNKKILAFIILLLVAMVSCSSPKPEPTVKATDFPTASPTQAVVEMPVFGDGGLFSEKPCASPCFFGIQIEETTTNQVPAILEYYGISPCVQYDETSIPCGPNFFANVWVTIDRSTSIVVGVGFNPSVPINVGDIIEKYGDPNSVWVELDGIPEATTVTMNLFWDSIKMDVDLGDIPEIGEQIYIVENTTDVKWISFDDEKSYSQITSQYSQPWNGYGTYKP